MESKQMKVACYARYSTNMQREESIDAQLRAMKDYCECKHWCIVKTYVDQAYSATTDKRPQFQKMIADSAKREFDLILVHKLDRFARNRYDSSLYKHKLRKNGVKLCSVLEHLDDSPESILLEGLLESVNEFYSANLARESMKGLKENALKCLHNGGSPGLGYDVDSTQHIILNKEEAKLVMMIFSMYLSGYSCNNIAEQLNSDGVHTKAGNPFTKLSIYGILKNPKYTGMYIFNRAEAKGYDHKRNSHRSKPEEDIIRIKGGIPSIISTEMWEAVQNRMAQKSGKPRNTKTMYLLSGKIKCGECGKAMNGAIRIRKQKESFLTYVCSTKKAQCDNFKEIDKNSLEQYVVGMIQHHCLCSKSDADIKLISQAKHDSPVFRYVLQSYLKDITVYKNSIILRLIVDGKIKIYQHKRKAFRTPTQRAFRD